MRLVLSLCLALPLSVACGDETDEQGPASSIDAGTVDSGTADSGEKSDTGAPDTGAPDSGAPEMGAPDTGPSGLKAAEAIPPLERFTPDGTWTLTSYSVDGPDPLFRAYAERRLDTPAEAGTFNGLPWSARGPEESGEFELLGILGPQRMYAALRLEVTETTRFVVRLRQLELLIDNVIVHSPDPYRTGRVIHPVVLEEGSHVLIFRGDNRRGPPSVVFERAASPIQPNVQDVTQPDLVPGEALNQPLGVHVVNLTSQGLSGVRAVVLDHPLFEATSRPQPDMPKAALTPVAFDLRPRGPLPSDVDTATLTLGLQADQTDALHTFEYALPLAPADRGLQRTFISKMDGSAQHYAITGPTTPPDSAALVLSLHGAAVQARGQARAYGTKDWAYIVAPTNRRPFGFDWQDWGRLDALEVMEEAKRTLPIDPEQVYLTGHSMGGHGTWHLGVLYPDLFAVVGPSAGWINFESYGGTSPLPEAWNAGRLHDETLDYKQNFADRGVYIIHGTNDNNVPVTQARTMYRELTGVTPDLFIHEEPGAGHWWDGDPEPGARCVDFREMFDLFRQKRRTLTELDFSFISPAPWVSPGRSYVSVDAVTDPYRAFEIQATSMAGEATVRTVNADTVVIDGARLTAAGIQQVVVNGERRAVEATRMRFGDSLKRPGVHGPIKEAFFNEFCFVHEDGAEDWEAVAANLTAIWAVIGNGSACTLPFSRRGEAGSRNRIYLGVASDRLEVPESIPFSWSADTVTLDGAPSARPTFLATTFPEGDHLAASFFGTTGAEWMMLYAQPFSSRAAFPDWFTFVLNDEGNPAYGPSGWFNADWAYDVSLRR